VAIKHCERCRLDESGMCDTCANEELKKLNATPEIDVKPTELMRLREENLKLTAENAALRRIALGYYILTAPEREAPTEPEIDAAIAEIMAQGVAQGVDEWIESRNGRWNGTTKEAEEFAANLRTEAAEKSNAFLKEELAQLANFNPDWDMLEACRESWREVVALLKDREAELAKLKGEQVPVGEVVRVLRGLQKVTDVVWKGGKVPEAGTKLFTAPQKLVVVNIPQRIVDIYLRTPLEVEDMTRDKYKAAIKAAGRTVKET